MLSNFEMVSFTMGPREIMYDALCYLASCRASWPFPWVSLEKESSRAEDDVRCQIYIYAPPSIYFWIPLQQCHSLIRSNPISNLILIIKKLWVNLSLNTLYLFIIIILVFMLYCMLYALFQDIISLLAWPFTGRESSGPSRDHV